MRFDLRFFGDTFFPSSFSHYGQKLHPVKESTHVIVLPMDDHGYINSYRTSKCSCYKYIVFSGVEKDVYFLSVIKEINHHCEI